MVKMNKATVSRKTNRIFKETVLYMQEIGTYKKEFDVTIHRYAEMRFQYDLLYQKWFEEGCKVTETFKNKSGNENIRKTAEYLAIETLQKNLLTIETTLGLTPKGLKAIKSNGLESAKQSRLAQVLSSV